MALINLYEVLNLPENANEIAIRRAIRLARERQDVDEKHLKLAENYLLDPKRRDAYNRQIGVKSRAQHNALSVGTDWRYIGGGIAVVLALFIPLMIIMVGNDRAIDASYKQRDKDYQEAQEAMEKAWGTKAASGESVPQAVERQLDDIGRRHEEQLQQAE